MQKSFVVCMCLIVLSSMFGITGCASSASQNFDLEKLFIGVFNPQPGEKVLVMMDMPHGSLRNNSSWEMRRGMAVEWHAMLVELGEKMEFTVYPILTYPATGAHNGPLPEEGEMDDQPVNLEEIFADVNIILALTEFSATAPLVEGTQKYPNLRVASMPTVRKAMEETALSADYSKVAKRAHILREKLEVAEGAEVVFSTDHRLYFDLRYRHAEVDDGQLPPDREIPRVINLPSGEAYMAPYEGEIENEPSKTEGTIPFWCGDGDVILFEVKENRVIDIHGEASCLAGVRSFFNVDEARRNIAELGLGVNDKAVITGNVLEDEKVMGMHWAAGRSDHIGGVIGVEDFSDPENAVHWDIVYPDNGPIEIDSLILNYEDGTQERIIREGHYTAFSLLPTKGQVTYVIERFMLVWGALTLVSLVFLIWGFTRNKSMLWGVRLAWVIILLIFGPLGLWVYWISYHAPISSDDPKAVITNWKDAMGLTAINVSVYVAVVYLLIAICVIFMPDKSISYWLLFIPFLAGLLLLRIPIIASMKKIGFIAALGDSLLIEIITFGFGAAGILATTVFLINQWFPRDISLADPLFYASALIAAIVGSFFNFPINLWMSERNFNKSLVWISIRDGTSEPIDILRILKIRDGWVSLVIAMAILAGSLGWVLTKFG
jgi:aminopeptidase